MKRDSHLLRMVIEDLQKEVSLLMSQKSYYQSEIENLREDGDQEDSQSEISEIEKMLDDLKRKIGKGKSIIEYINEEEEEKVENEDYEKIITGIIDCTEEGKMHL